jgi:hypothetical protein
VEVVVVVVEGAAAEAPFGGVDVVVVAKPAVAEIPFVPGVVVAVTLVPARGAVPPEAAAGVPDAINRATLMPTAPTTTAARRAERDIEFNLPGV